MARTKPRLARTKPCLARTKPCLARLAVIAGTAIACAAFSLPGYAQSGNQGGVAARALPVQSPFYACFNAATALRIGNEVTFDAAGVGKVRHWVVERFKSGDCVALPVGTEIARITNVVVSGHNVQRFQVAGSREWLIRPDWAMAQDRGDGRIETRRQAFLAMVPITVALMDYAARHIECLIEVKALNERVTAHNTEVTEEREAAKDGITRTVIIMAPSELDERGGRLSREVEDFRERCSPYRMLEAATPFVRMVRELGGLDPDLPQGGAA